MKNNARLKSQAMRATAGVAGLLMLSACGSDGYPGSDRVSSSISVTVIGGGDTNSNGKLDDHEFPNNGSEKVVSPGLKGFVCDEALRSDIGVKTVVGANGLVGGGLNQLLNTLGANGVSSLLAGISGPDDAIDGDLETFAGFTLLLDLLKIVSSLDLAVELPEGKRVAAGKYAAFAVSLPPSLLQLSLGLNVKVATFLDDQATGDSTSLSLPQLNLLGLGGTQYGFIGLQVTKPYDKAVISLSSDVLSINLAKDSLRVHELCVNGHKVAG